MKIIEHAASFEVQSDMARSFGNSLSTTIRAVGRYPACRQKKRALQEARTFAGKGAVLVPRSS
jgi:hypothetical protein